MSGQLLAAHFVNFLDGLFDYEASLLMTVTFRCHLLSLPPFLDGDPVCLSPARQLYLNGYRERFGHDIRMADLTKEIR